MIASSTSGLGESGGLFRLGGNLVTIHENYQIIFVILHLPSVIWFSDESQADPVGS